MCKNDWGRIRNKHGRFTKHNTRGNANCRGNQTLVVPMKITSSAFSNNGRIPVKCTCDGSDTIPPLNFENVPENVESLVLIMADPDAVEVVAYVADHWIVSNI